MLDKTSRNKSLSSNNLETENSVNGKEGIENVLLKRECYKKINPLEEITIFWNSKLKWHL